MVNWTQFDRRVGIWSASAIVLLSFAYILTGMIWIISSSNGPRIQGLEPSEPFLTILETLILLCAPAIVLLFAAMHAYAPANRKTCSRAAFGFALLLSGITGVVHFVQLTAVRRTGSKVIIEALAMYDPSGRLTPVLAADLVAWDFFFGFALLFAGLIFSGDKLQGAIRAAFITA